MKFCCREESASSAGKSGAREGGRREREAPSLEMINCGGWGREREGRERVAWVGRGQHFPLLFPPLPLSPPLSSFVDAIRTFFTRVKGRPPPPPLSLLVRTFESGYCDSKNISLHPGKKASLQGEC